ncbi:MAG: transcriptional regulator GcvA [Candidatus Competibacteraceae bacterium]|nr:transcriptional regulator GcvA [Candidatus Competibacteraceae bacterium]
MQKIISFKAIQTFEAAARLSSFALAAEELFVTPSAISHQIKLLEEEIGVRLFHRVHRSVVLTDVGRRYAHEIAAAFARIEAATRNTGCTEKSDILTVHSAPSIAAQWLMPRLARFSALYPDIDVSVHASTDLVNLTDERLDVDIRYGPIPLHPTGTLVLTLPPETIVPLSAPQLANGNHPIRTVADLRHHTLIHSEICLVRWRDWLRDYEKVKLDITRGPRFDRSFMAISAAVDGRGVCLESLLLAERELEAGKLVAPLGLDGPKVSGYTFNVLKSRADLPKIKNFQEWLFAELAVGSKWRNYK